MFLILTRDTDLRAAALQRSVCKDFKFVFMQHVPAHTRRQHLIMCVCVAGLTGRWGLCIGGELVLMGGGG